MSDACQKGCVVTGLAYADPNLREGLIEFQSRAGIYVRNTQRDAIITTNRHNICVAGRELSRVRKFSWRVLLRRRKQESISIQSALWDALTRPSINRCDKFDFAPLLADVLEQKLGSSCIHHPRLPKKFTPIQASLPVQKLPDAHGRYSHEIEDCWGRKMRGWIADFAGTGFSIVQWNGPTRKTARSQPIVPATVICSATSTIDTANARSPCGVPGLYRLTGAPERRLLGDRVFNTKVSDGISTLQNSTTFSCNGLLELKTPLCSLEKLLYPHAPGLASEESFIYFSVRAPSFANPNISLATPQRAGAANAAAAHPSTPRSEESRSSNNDAERFPFRLLRSSVAAISGIACYPIARHEPPPPAKAWKFNHITEHPMRVRGDENENGVQ
ncbi:hypothetical protein B0H11DRAFT_1908229 [Mycena galericulata]|nr:hypothetical protein B0H11DRAFT_1908229 [Mycena galericulata]